MPSVVDVHPRQSVHPGDGHGLVLSDGSGLSWDEVFQELRPALTAYARSRGVRDPEDLVQDVFVAAVKLQDRFEGDLPGLRSLLFTIAYRRVADEHRRWYRHRETLVGDHMPVPDPAPTVEEVVCRSETTTEAMQAFAALTDREQHVLHMRIFDDATPGEVGQVLGLSSGNVRVIQARALVKIRHHLRSTAGGALPAITIAGVPIKFVRYLRTDLPNDDVLGSWLTEVRTATTAATPGAAAEMSGFHLAAMAENAASILSSGLGSGIARLGAVFSVVALSAGASATLPLEAGDTTPGIQSEAALSTKGVADLASTMPVGMLSGAPVVADGAEDAPTIVVPDPPPITAKESEPPVAAPDSEPEPEEPELVTQPNPDPDSDPGQSPEANLVDGLVDDVVVPLVENAAQTTVTGVLGPLAEGVVDPLVKDLVEPLVEDTAHVVKQDVVEPLVDDVVDPLIDEAGDALDETGSLLGKLLGLP